MTRTAYEYGQLIVYRDTTAPGGNTSDWPVKGVWYEGASEGAEVTDLGLGMTLLNRLGREGWQMVGAPQIQKSFVYDLKTRGKGDPPTVYTNPANEWIQVLYTFMRKVDGS